MGVTTTLPEAAMAAQAPDGIRADIANISVGDLTGLEYVAAAHAGAEEEPEEARARQERAASNASAGPSQQQVRW